MEKVYNVRVNISWQYDTRDIKTEWEPTTLFKTIEGAQKYKSFLYESFCKETLELLIGEAAESFEILPLEQDLEILRNVIYSGVWQRYHLKMERKERKEGAHAE